MCHARSTRVRNKKKILIAWLKIKIKKSLQEQMKVALEISNSFRTPPTTSQMTTTTTTTTTTTAQTVALHPKFSKLNKIQRKFISEPKEKRNATEISYAKCPPRGQLTEWHPQAWFKILIFLLT